MVGTKKVMGVCLACMHSGKRAEYLDKVNRTARANNWMVFVFNSPSAQSDENKNIKNRHGDGRVFDVPNYNIIDALLLFSDSIQDEELKERLRGAARVWNRPIIEVTEDTENKSFSLVGDCESTGLGWLLDLLETSENDRRFIYARRENAIECDGKICRVADFLFDMIDDICDIDDPSQFYQEIKERLVPDSYLCIRSDLNDINYDSPEEADNMFSPEMNVVYSVNLSRTGRQYEIMRQPEMIPDLMEAEENGKLYIVTSVYAGQVCCGYYIVMSDSCARDAEIIRRKIRILNLLFKLLTAKLNQVRLVSEIEKSYMKNSVIPQPDLNDYFNTFELLIDRNLFKYHFQPIIDAHTGDIVAYEALMRTGGGISMTPLDVLEIAKKTKRLYDVEKATLFNIMGEYVSNAELFGERRVFINTIPGYFLEDEDLEVLKNLYGEWFDRFVYEVTEQNTITNEELAKIRGLCHKEDRASIAVDDYGTGHSNIVNLLRYEPHVIKIDRFLISDIQNDSNKQMFVKNTIEFAARNHIKVLAEGVETSDELKKVIEYGVDYIQGYYTARPMPEILQKLPEEIRNEIIEENLKASRYDERKLEYDASDGETVNLLELALKNISFLNISEGTVRVVGEKSNMIDMMIKTADWSDTKVILENVNLKADTDTTISLGEKSHCTIEVVGTNTLNKDGIRCPKGASLDMTGDGTLQIFCSRNYCIGIGSNSHEFYGDMTFDMDGMLKIYTNGNEVAGIGGGGCENSKIRLLKGKFDIGAKGISGVAIGSLSGDSDIYLGNVECRLRTDGNDSLCVGSVKGTANIRTAAKLDIAADGESTVGIGTIRGTANISIEDNVVSAILHTYSGAAIGSVNDEANISIVNSTVSVYCEGTVLTGIGSGSGAGCTDVIDGNVNVEILAGVISELGSEETRTYLNSGRIYIPRDNNVSVSVYGSNRELLEPIVEDGGYLFRVGN